MPEPVAVVLAAGTGSRVGSEQPKQLLEIAGRPVVAHTVGRLGWCARVVVAFHPDHEQPTRDAVATTGVPGVHLVAGGTTRRESLAAALAALDDLPDDVPLVLQNAASPNTPRELVEECVAALADHDVVQAYVPAVQTIFRHQGGELAEVLPRAELGCSADPTVYRLGTLRRVVEVQATQAGAGEMTLDTARGLGIGVRLVRSPSGNLKLTTAEDLTVLRSLMGPG